jgi:hypothetical protein
MPNFRGVLGNRDVLVLTIGYTATASIRLRSPMVSHDDRGRPGLG